MINLDVRYVDSETGRGVAVDSISGIVKNAAGTVIETITPNPMADDDGVLYRKEYDVSDAAKFFGLFLTVDWAAVHSGIRLPVVTKKYEFAPVSEYPADKTVVYWLAPDNAQDVLFYEIYRERNSTQVLAGRSFGPFFIDRHPFENEYEARSWRYKIAPAIRKPGIDYSAYSSGVDYEVLSSSILADWTVRTAEPLCSVIGRIVDLSGRPGFAARSNIEAGSVVFRPDNRNRHQFLRGNYILPEDVFVQITSEGSFEAVLLQDSIAEVWIPASNFRARFVVPRKDRAALADLDFEVLS